MGMQAMGNRDAEAPPGDAANAADCAGADRRVPSCGALFRAFALVGLTGFGGVLPWARSMVVDRRGWLDDREFAELLPLAQLLPGPNVANIAVILGRRYHGAGGSASAVAGLYCFPTLVIIAIGLLFQRWGQLPIVQHVLSGVMPAAAGLMLATAVRLLVSLPHSAHTVLFAAATFAGTVLLGLPLLVVLAVLGPLAVIAMRFRQRVT